MALGQTDVGDDVRLPGELFYKRSRAFMAFRRRFQRRRARGSWAVSSPTSFNITGTGTPSLDAFPVIDNAVPDIINVAATFQNLPGNQFSGWMHKRTVGQVHCALEQNDTSPGAGDVQAVEVFLGMFADRTGPPGETLLNLNAWDPWSASAQKKRWLFRRHWVLGNGGYATNHAVFGSEHFNWPETNSASFGMNQGPSIDIKMKQRLSYEENLFWMTAMQVTEFFGSTPPATTVRWYFNTRSFINVFQGDNR